MLTKCYIQGQSKDVKKKRKEGNMDMEVTFTPGLKGLLCLYCANNVCTM